MGEIRNHEHPRTDTPPEYERCDSARLAREQEALRRVATLVAHGESSVTVFNAIVEELAGVLGVDGTKMLRHETDGTVTIIASWGVPEHCVGTRAGLEGANVTTDVLRTGRTAWMDRFHGPAGSLGWLAARHGVKRTVGAPIVVEGKIWGVMIAMSVHDRAFPPEAEERLGQFTDLAGTAIANSQAREDLAASRSRLVTAGDRADRPDRGAGRADHRFQSTRRRHVDTGRTAGVHMS